MTLWDGLKEFARQQACNIFSTGYDAYRLLQNISTGSPSGAGPFSDAVKIAFCNNPTPTPPLPLPPQEGQCPGVQYQVTYSYTGQPPGRQPITYGPFTFFACGSVSYREGKGAGNIDALFFTTSGFSFQGGAPCGESQETEFDNFVAPGTAQVSIVRVDGQPDNCGSDTPILPPAEPGWNERAGDVTYVNNEGNNVTIPVVAAFGYANVDINANVNIPVKVDVGGIKLGLNLNLTTGDINLFPTNNYYGDRRPGDRPIDILPPPGEEPPDYPDGLPPPPPPVSEEEEEGEKIIIGCVVTVTEISGRSISTLFQSDNPDIKIPNLGHINFLCRFGFMDAAWTSDIPVKNIRNIIQCPWEPGAFKVTGTPQPGVSWVITPLYSIKQPAFVFPGDT